MLNLYALAPLAVLQAHVADTPDEINHFVPGATVWQNLMKKRLLLLSVWAQRDWAALHCNVIKRPF